MSAKRHSLILRLLLLPFLLLRPVEGSSLDLIPVSILKSERKLMYLQKINKYL